MTSFLLQEVEHTRDRSILSLIHTRQRTLYTDHFVQETNIREGTTAAKSGDIAGQIHRYSTFALMCEHLADEIAVDIASASVNIRSKNVSLGPTILMTATGDLHSATHTSERRRPESEAAEK
jgi:hypothetical protein